MKKLITKLYILGFMVLTLFFMHIIWKVTFGHLFEENHFQNKIVAIASMKNEAENKPKQEASFQEAILEGEERVKHYLGVQSPG